MRYSMRILLIHPPDNKVSIAPGRFEPLALEVLAACLPEHEVRILDLRIDSPGELGKQIDRFKPDVAGITANNTIHANTAKQVVNRIASRHPEVNVVVGGFHATMMPQDFHTPGVNAIFLGWAEKSFPQYISFLEKGKPLNTIHGIEILENGRLMFHNNGQWDLQPADIPFPRRDLVRKYQNRYRSDMGFKTSLVNTSRGCPSRCSFCGVWQVSGGHFLLRQPEDVFREIAELPAGIGRVFFADDNTFIHPGNAARLCRLIRGAGIKKKYSGYCRSDTIIKNRELMEEWREAGLDNLCVGFEGVDDRRLQQLNKRNSEENNARAAEILNAIGIPFRPHFIIDPAFTEREFADILAYVKKHRLKSPIFPIMTPIPGTPYYEEVKDRIILGHDYFDFAHSTVPTTLSAPDFYQSWFRLYYGSYPLVRNLKMYFLNLLARITKNSRKRKKYDYLKPAHLFTLRILAVFLQWKLTRHYKSLSW